MIERPIRIAGAGPSGLAAAIGLAQRGAAVEIHERRAQPGGGEHSTRFDAIENWTTARDLLDTSLDQSLELPILRPDVFEVLDDRGRVYRLAADRPLLYAIRRGSAHDELEGSLWRRALDLGVRFRFGSTLERAQADIWAVGHRLRGRFVAACVDFQTDGPSVVRVIVDRELAPNAYAYMIAVDGRATISVVLTRNHAEARKRLASAVAAFQRLDSFSMRDAHFGGGTGGVIRAFRNNSADPVVVGEAAGLQDYLWGFGIRHALDSGYLAARVLAEPSAFAIAAQREIRPMVRSSIALRAALDVAGKRGDRAMVQLVASRENPSSLLRRAYRLPAMDLIGRSKSRRVHSSRLVHA